MDSAPGRADATFYAVAGDGVRWSSCNFPEQFLRPYDSEFWPATPGGANTWDDAASFTEDTTWTVEAPWAP